MDRKTGSVRPKTHKFKISLALNKSKRSRRREKELQTVSTEGRFEGHAGGERTHRCGDKFNKV